MREFVLFSRTGRTDGTLKNLRKAGRLDVVYQCILTSLFVSHGIRKDVNFHAFLNGPPKPPKHLEIKGSNLHDVRVDEITWAKILRKVLNGKKHPGIKIDKIGFHEFLSKKEEIYILEEKGENIFQIEFGKNPVFVIGDQVGLPKKEEKWLLRKAKKISLGKQRYLAASCIDILNFILDVRK